MDENKVILYVLGAVATLIGSLATIIFTQHSTIQKQKKEQDDSKTEKIAVIEKELETIKISLELVKIELSAMKENFTLFYETYNFKHSIKYKIEQKADIIIKSSPDLNKDLTTLLLEGRDYTIILANFVYFNKLQLNQKNLENEVGLIYDKLKILTNTYFKEVKGGYNFSEYLKYKSELPDLGRFLMREILVYTSLKNEEKTNEKFISIFENFLNDCFLCSISAYNKYKIL